MIELDRILAAVVRTWSDPVLRHAAARAALAAVLVDVMLGLLPTRAASLIGALHLRLRGWAGAIMVGLLHPLLLGTAAVLLLLASTRVPALLRLWPLTGVGLGAVLACAVMLLGGQRHPLRLIPLLLVGLAMTLAGRLTAVG